MTTPTIFQSIKNALENYKEDGSIGNYSYRYEPCSGEEIYETEGFVDAINILRTVEEVMLDEWDPDRDGEIRVLIDFRVGNYAVVIKEMS